TQRACEKFKTTPVAVFNFLEGTRLTPEKHAEQQSPYRYLLRPKSGGIASVLDAPGEQLRSLLDSTIHSPAAAPPSCDTLRGRLRWIPPFTTPIARRPSGICSAAASARW